MAFQSVGITLCVLFMIGGRAWVRHFGFAVCFFLVAVPWPTPVEIPVVQSLMQLNATATVEALSWFGIPALQHGNVIEISTGVVGIDEACSGVRSLQATLMISLFLGELYRFKIPHRLLLIAAGAGLAFLFNVGRTFTLVCVAARDGLKAMEKWHDPVGVGILLGCFCGLWALGALLRAKGEGQSGKGKGVRAKGQEVSGKGKELSGKGEELGAKGQEVSGKGREVGGRRLDQTSNCELRSSDPDRTANCELRTASSGLLVALVACFVVAEVGTEAWYRLHERGFAPNPAWVAQPPTGKNGFKVVEIPESIRSQLLYNDGQQSVWKDGDGRAWSAFFFHWEAPRTLNERFNVQLALSHRPEICLTGVGKRLQADLGIKPFLVNGFILPFHVFTFVDDRGPLHVFYAQSEDRIRKLAEGNVGNYGTRQRLQAAWEGRRHIGFRVMEVAVSGFPDLAPAEEAFRQLLPEMIKPE